jgi:hypothetical protein
MRNKLLSPDNNLTPLGAWIAARIPHGRFELSKAWRFDDKSLAIRLYGFRPYYRFVIFDLTRCLGHWHLTLFNMPIFQNPLFVAGEKL